MQLVVEISEDTFFDLKKKQNRTEVDNAVLNGTPLPKGHWIEDDEQRHVEKTYHCSECGHGAWGEYEKTEYCGGCGAKMVEPQESEEEK